MDVNLMLITRKIDAAKQMRARMKRLRTKSHPSPSLTLIPACTCTVLVLMFWNIVLNWEETHRGKLDYLKKKGLFQLLVHRTFKQELR